MKDEDATELPLIYSLSQDQRRALISRLLKRTWGGWSFSDNKWLFSSRCVEWRGCKEAGYGIVSKAKYGERLAHRAMFSLMNCGIMPGMLICHKCNNRDCINPYHLYEGTASDNARDAKRDRRRHLLAGISPETIADVQAELKNGYSESEIADGHELSILQIRAIEEEYPQ